MSWVFSRTPTSVEVRIEAATRLYGAAPTSATWDELYAAVADALAYYKRLPTWNSQDRKRYQLAAVLDDLEWRGIAVQPEHAVGHPRRPTFKDAADRAETRLEAAVRVYGAAPTSAAWRELYAACAAVLSLYGLLPSLSRGRRIRVSAVLADLGGRGIAVRPEHAAISLERGGYNESRSGKSTSSTAKAQAGGGQKNTQKGQFRAGSGAIVGRY